MEELQPVNKCLQSFSKLPLWIIEYVWAHRMMDIQQVVDSFNWPEIDSQPLSLEDSGRLRVASAQVYFIVKNRDMEKYERVMSFLDATYRLLPRLVSPIKHMKIMFGLKTMVIMQMLRDSGGMVDTVFKINHLFPSKLPQYQDQCSQKQIFLMRKNHLDFKVFAQALAMDKDKLEDYVKNQMEEQYGERYAQKVEDRLLHYLHRLEAVLPGDTYIDKILKKDSPVTEEEKLLLEVVTSDSATITTTLKKLLHCDVTSCHPDRVCPSPQHEKIGKGSSQLANSALYGSSSRTPLKSVETKSLNGGDKADQGVSKDSWHLLDNDSDVRRHHQTEEESSDKDKAGLSQRGSEHVQKAASSPQFCSKHQRWVRSILQGCPDECSEELQAQANVSSSPPMFQSSSSGSSSEDLTPSDLVPLHSDQQHPPSQTSTHLHTATQALEQTEEKQGPGSPLSPSDTSPTEPTSSRVLLTPVVRLIDIASVRGFFPAFEPQQASPNHNQQAASASSPQAVTSENDAVRQGSTKDSTVNQAETKARDASTSTESKPPTEQRPFELSRKFRVACSTEIHSNSQFLGRISHDPSAQTTFENSCPLLPEVFSFSGPPLQSASTSTSQSGNLNSFCTANQIPLSTESSRQVVPQTSVPCFTVVSSTSNTNCLSVSRVQRAQLRISLSSQAVLLQSKLLQPFVSLVRLSTQECHRVTKRRSSARHVEPAAQGSNSENNNDRRMEEGDDADSSFDVNLLYSSFYSSSEGEDSLDCDPDYKPHIKKKRLLLEYEAARSMNHT